MKIGLHDAEKKYSHSKIKFPNLALMKISAYHKLCGDTVEWWNPLDEYDKVYSSKVFTFTPNCDELPPNTIRGGTGYIDIPIDNKLPSEIDKMFPDYSIYPDCDFAIGYITRGCVRNCSWCCVSQKEGNITSYRKFTEIVRFETDNLILMDNNILASNFGQKQLCELSKSHYKIDCNQGLDCRIVTPKIADILAKINWIHYIRFSCDSTSQILDCIRVAFLLKRRGIVPSKLFFYVLVKTDISEAEKIVEALKNIGAVTIYAQPKRDFNNKIIPTKAQKEFAKRYVWGGSFRKETWLDYCAKRNLTFMQK
jgi:hypothetical protein